MLNYPELIINLAAQEYIELDLSQTNQQVREASKPPSQRYSFYQ